MQNRQTTHQATIILCQHFLSKKTERNKKTKTKKNHAHIMKGILTIVSKHIKATKQEVLTQKCTLSKEGNVPKLKHADS